MAAFVFRIWHWVISYGTFCSCVHPVVCCSNVVVMSMMPFVDFLKEFYPFVNCDIVTHLIW